MRTISCVITDDEPVARKGLQGYVEKVDFLRLAGVFDNAISLNSFLKDNRVDLLFLDIEMPYLSGLDLLQSLTDPPKVIFTTAYEQYALKGYELEVTDYLLKPISFERFLKAVNRVYAATGEVAGPLEATPHLFVKTDSKLEKVLLDDLLYVEAMENYIALHTIRGRLITHATLKSVVEHLPADTFLQVHKSYVVNMGKITHLEGNMIGIGKATIPLSRGLKESVMETLLRNKLL
ncbi:LytR/AlgR family response regulator transcription factor [Dinghuibacter silviterrae]|uniref:LytTR family two component transcriptional regulator n=1 Tax=Dinghuibacter silviterrae TaxID=1539049 RepID=A0A4R8DTF5_9BACT|nr:LytTR family DNA-binding domain-containing protein [Dinghuibacter silviterrae]TDX01186.1 LytTR family two component transcriptional regulator [Dinghuibacter silviterrae]